MEQKSIQKNFRITEKQQVHLDHACEKYGITESEFLRRLIDSDMGIAVPKETQESYQFRKQLLYEINKIGTNINQIVKNVNSHCYSDHEKKQLFASMKKLQELISQGGIK